ncbi:hypothetical protein SAMN05660642_01933 [Geodermatophilus siccatus]|uniref:DNA-binding transcriptional regulator, MarR family n=1 Tax=Geodermatophilus siccatus TaxID=1137991 RepID=A0A1G9RHX4_9ACTN|nr:hypothetical protein [Geodermatophilus siccatus]SDM22828.1 hypothetical protein SAMN05660642_01933 [Geodermatophilus siccatus]
MPPGDGEPRWLDEAETAAWLPLVRLVTLLPPRLGGQLREDAGIGHVHHQILAMLSQGRDEDLRMSEPAGRTPAGRAALDQVVPGHVAEVRRLVFDQLMSHEVDQLTGIATELLDAASR